MDQRTQATMIENWKISIADKKLKIARSSEGHEEKPCPLPSILKI
jgi:hypothetical protein